MATAPNKPPRIPPREPEEMTPEEREQYLANPMAQTNLARLFSLAPVLPTLDESGPHASFDTMKRYIEEYADAYIGRI